MFDPALPPDGERRLAVVPLRSFRHAKSRLSHSLGEAERAALAEEMARRVLGTVTAVLPVAVVSGDDDVLAMAEAFGALAVRERPNTLDSGSNLNAALADAVWEAEGLAVHTLAVVFGDLPHLGEDDVTALLRLPSRPGMVVAPDHTGTGTNAICLSPPAALDFRFGPGSFRRHVAAAYRANLPVKVLRRPGLANDIDTPEDLARVMRRPVLQTSTGRSRSVVDREGR